MTIRLRERLLPRLERIRRIPGRFGLRRFRVFVRVITYSTNRPDARFITSTTNTEILVGGFGPKVREVKSEEIVAGTDMNVGDWVIEPVTPEFIGGGTSPEDLDPPQTATCRELLYVIKGPGLDDAGALCDLIESTMTRPFRYRVVVRMRGRSG